MLEELYSLSSMNDGRLQVFAFYWVCAYVVPRSVGQVLEVARVALLLANHLIGILVHEGNLKL